jgi:excisionase family DNA binding protein
MIYFKSIKLVHGFLITKLINKEKSDNIDGWLGQPSRIYLKNSSKEFKSVQEIIDELISMYLLHEIIEFTGPFCTDPKSHGYILSYSQIKVYLDNKEDFLNYQINNYRLLTVNQACEFLNISRPTLYKLIKDGEIKDIEIMGKKRIQVIDLMNYISTKNMTK